MKKITLVLVFLCLANFFVVAKTKAQDYFPGGIGSNLAVKEGKANFLNEQMDIQLHLGFAEVYQTYKIENPLSTPQKITFGFSYNQTNRQNGVDNLKIFIENAAPELVSNQEVINNQTIYWKYFSADFAANETKTVSLSHWQLNGANLKGLRTFNYTLAGKNQLIDNLAINLSLADQINPINFQKTFNPDLELKVEPAGAKQDKSRFSWQWQNITPAFNLQTNFYWPNGDLSKISLDKTLSLYKIKTDSAGISDNGAALADSSYLTAYKGKAMSATLGDQIEIDFEENKIINQFMIIPGIADSQENFAKSHKPQQLTLKFDNELTKTIELQNELGIQTFNFDPITTKKVILTVNKTFTGLDSTDTALAISEIEFNHVSAPEIIKEYTKPAETWQQKFQFFWQNIWLWFKNLVS